MLSRNMVDRMANNKLVCQLHRELYQADSHKVRQLGVSKGWLYQVGLKIIHINKTGLFEIDHQVIIHHT